MEDVDTVQALISELRNLSQNLQGVKQSTDTLHGDFKDLQRYTRAVYAVGKQVKILNQIMLQVSRTAGMSGMLSNLLRSITEFADQQGRRGG